MLVLLLNPICRGCTKEFLKEQRDVNFPILNVDRYIHQPYLDMFLKACLPLFLRGKKKICKLQVNAA